MAKRSASPVANMFVNSGVDLRQTYKDIPFFVRVRLRDKINQTQWFKVSMETHKSDTTEATRLYQEIMKDIQQYISKNAQSEEQTLRDDAQQMSICKWDLFDKFDKDHVGFAKAMSDCLRNEGTLVNTSYWDNGEEESSESCTIESEERNIQSELYLASIKCKIQSLREDIVTFNKVNEEVNKPVVIQIQGHGQAASSAFQVQQTLFENCLMKMDELVELCKECVETLLEEIKDLKAKQVKSEVGLGRPVTINADSFPSCSAFVLALNTLLSWYPGSSSQQHHKFPDNGILEMLCSHERNENSTSNVALLRLQCIQSELFHVEKTYIEGMMLISVQLPRTVSIIGNDKKFDTKKGQQFPFELLMPAANNFHNFNFVNVSVEYIKEEELAEMVAAGQSPTSGPIQKTVGVPKYSHLVPQDDSGELKFVNLTLQNISRQNVKNMEFIRVRCHITVLVNGRQYEIKVLSLPFHLITGSNQLLQCHGTRMWYFFTSPDMYNGDFKMQEKISQDEFINMLDHYVRYVDDNSGRWLRPEEKQYLVSRMADFDMPAQQVSRDDFIRRKEQENRSQNATKKEMLSYHQWIHAIVCSIRTRDLDNWNQGAIYGLIGEQQAEKILMAKNVKPYKFLLRYSSHYVDRLSSDNPRSGLIMAVKRFVEKEETYEIQSFPLNQHYVDKYGVYDTVMGWLKALEKEGLDLKNCTDLLYTYRNPDMNVSTLKKICEENNSVKEDVHYRTSWKEAVHMELVPFTGVPVQKSPAQDKGKGKAGAKVVKKSRKSSSVSQPSPNVNSESESPRHEDDVLIPQTNVSLTPEPATFIHSASNKQSGFLDAEQQRPTTALETDIPAQTRLIRSLVTVDTSYLTAQLNSLAATTRSPRNNPQEVTNSSQHNVGIASQGFQNLNLDEAGFSGQYDTVPTNMNAKDLANSGAPLKANINYHVQGMISCSGQEGVLKTGGFTGSPESLVSDQETDVWMTEPNSPSMYQNSLNNLSGMSINMNHSATATQLVSSSSIQQSTQPSEQGNIPNNIQWEDIEDFISSQ